MNLKITYGCERVRQIILNNPEHIRLVNNYLILGPKEDVTSFPLKNIIDIKGDEKDVFTFVNYITKDKENDIANGKN